jgi:hypothetical protein
MLEEHDRSSLEILERFEALGGPEADVEGLSRTTFLGEDELELDIEFLPSTSSLQVGPPAQIVDGQKSESRAARRRRKIRERNPASQPKAERMAIGRVRKAQPRGVHTNIELKVLRPGLKLVGCEKKVYTLAELRKMRFAVVKWNGL